ncbi:hypothetical protein PTTG_28836 [Puccinia triticina 1-1 BBBD Race 1]|uniref:Cutinase n=2 Tax=Puccinia triticina TaxID=208348 RepID=A0A180G8R5_PUCT1|nr:uncharacterized protein PtA15_6A510 [Puccinia triticina]OAV89041.1 hypothetical protein PTTG_28836 [Puccinia triticina 1-1 BBBD Race 1]WAQ85881.1 hypothetical protein PtA15_6A510 [Puccinia triticina]WAR55774.1 hypothetical protein PtB15_6B517 [Puccinia triticina]
MLLSNRLATAFAFLNLLNSSVIVGAFQAEEVSFQAAASVKADPTSPCGLYQIVAARGTNEAQSGSPTYANLINIIETTIPGGSNVEIDYSAIMEYVTSPIKGAAAGAAYLSDQMVKCPDQKYVFVGYSKGAMVISQLMKELPISADKVVAIVLFGNPFHTPNAPQNRCSGSGGSGLASYFAPPIPSQYVSLTYDCCILWDMVCQTIGTVFNHLKYRGSQDEKNAAAFVVSQLRRKLGRMYK